MSDGTLLIQKLKDYTARIYQLTPSELVEFIKIKGNLLRMGIVLDEELLGTTDDVILGHIESTVVNGVCPSLDQLLSADVGVIEQERVSIRKQLFDTSVLVKVIQAGTSFAVNWDKRLKTCKVTIPSSWRIAIDHVLLMNQYDAISGSLPGRDMFIAAEEERALELFVMYQDYALVRYMIEEPGRDCSAELLIRSLRKGITVGKVSVGEAISWIGPHRRRLIQMLTLSS